MTVTNDITRLLRWTALIFVCVACLQLCTGTLATAAHPTWPWWYAIQDAARSAIVFYVALHLVTFHRAFPVWARTLSLSAVLALQVAAVVIETHRMAPSHLEALNALRNINIGLSALMIPVVLFAAVLYEYQRRRMVLSPLG